ncbi:hypothetical protein Y032_0290g1540 [Ancylostoma ceylanicum]|uniref:Uncharacterized protein n=1 Tax=Ancylostoma ceylanicum TaxID=53326 RepID=A0A016S577_9BILA|nr:hypothetical protein Y032_0290g1540 [Ancylostoma ceylanicum]
MNTTSIFCTVVATRISSLSPSPGVVSQPTFARGLVGLSLIGELYNEVLVKQQQYSWSITYPAYSTVLPTTS